MTENALAMSQDNEDEFAQFGKLFEFPPRRKKTSFQHPWKPQRPEQIENMRALLAELGLSLERDINRNMRARDEAARSVGFTFYDPCFKFMEELAELYGLSVAAFCRAVCLAFAQQHHKAGAFPGIDEEASAALVESIAAEDLH